MLNRTLNDFFSIEGNTLILNNYNYFDTEILEIRIQALYGERTLRPFIDSKITKMSQNVVDMYKDYLAELFTFPEKYKLFEPEVKKIIRDMNYLKTNDDTRDITGSSDTQATQDTTFHGNDDRTIKDTKTIDYGKITDHDTTETFSDDVNGNTHETVSHTGNVQTSESGKNDGTLTKAVSAYNQTEPTYTPREQETTNTTNSGTNSVTNNLTDTSDGTTHSDTVSTREIKETITESGSDTIEDNTKDNLTSESTNKNTSSSTTADTHKDVLSGQENYKLNEIIEEDGRLTYDEIINAIENIFNPYDWMAAKIVYTICEVIYFERIKKI